MLLRREPEHDKTVVAWANRKHACPVTSSSKANGWTDNVRTREKDVRLNIVNAFS